MIVVADTSPLNYLIQIDCDHLLPKLYGQVLIPEAVMQEMRHPRAPIAVQHWIANTPPWIDVVPLASALDERLASLGLGELAAIQLAEERDADLLLIDELRDRFEATRRRLSVTGTLGIFLRGGRFKLIDPETAYRRLVSETTFRTSADLEAQFLRQVRTT